MSMDIRKKIYVAGHKGMVGSALVRTLQAQGANNLLLADSRQLDLTRQTDVEAFLAQHRPDYMIVAAAKVGGIHANDTYPAEFIYDNLMIEANLIHGAYKTGVTQLLFLGSSCIYPKLAPQPMTEDCLLSGALEPTNAPYAIAKIAGIKLCEAYNRQYGTDYRAAMPTNLYGPHDNYHAQNSHVIPALIRRFHEAKADALPAVSVWGSGQALREFLHVDDLAEGCLHIMNLEQAVFKHALPAREVHVNIGSGQEVSIASLAQTVAKVVGYKGKIEFDATKPDGAPRKLMDSSKLATLGWQSRIGLEEGLGDAYRWFLEHAASRRQ